jgi:DNA-directed RNA polymerase specialized sigma24 family protein
LLSKIDDHERRVICLKYIHEMGPTEVALRVGCHPASVRKTVMRALVRLKTAAVR